MVYKLRLMEIDLEFDKRPYNLGETIDVTVGLRPRSDTQIRGARVDLICEERYVQMASTFIPDTYSQMSTAGSVISGKTGYAGDEKRERFVHSTVQVLEAGTLSQSSPGPRAARLRVELTTPPHLEESWGLERDANSAWAFK